MTTSDTSPNRIARTAGLFYLVTFIAGFASLAGPGTMARVGAIISGLSYIAVTILFYRMYRPVSPRVSAVATLVGLAGIAASFVETFHVAKLPVNSLAAFGVYCLLLGYLTLASTFLPKVIGVLLLLAGCGWLTFASPALTHMLQPYNFIPGIVGEAALTFWLLVRGVNETRWRAQASAQASLSLAAAV